MQSTRRVLEEVMAGRSIGEGLWKAALAEVEMAEALEAKKGDLVVVQSPEVTPRDQVVLALGMLFIVLEDFMLEMRARGHFDSVRGDVGDALIAARTILRKYGYEPVRNRQRERMVFTVNPKKV